MTFPGGSLGLGLSFCFFFMAAVDIPGTYSLLFSLSSSFSSEERHEGTDTT
jgi:hypothetical protein